MADTKLSALTELATTPAVGDELYIRDISEAASAESKRITVANLMAAASAGATLTVAETEVFSGYVANTWIDLDLSGVVGSNAALVVLKVKATSYSLEIAFRKNGDTDEFYAGVVTKTGCALVTCSTTVHNVVIVATDDAGIIEWKTSKAGDSDYDATIDIIAFMK